MDAPLLALTRRRPGAPVGLSEGAATSENMRQLAQLRWIAVVGQTATILLVHLGLGISLPLWEMLGIALMLALANAVITLTLSWHDARPIQIVLALLLDMAALTLQLYLSGGAANPFVILFLVQVVLGAILLPPRATALLLVAAVGSYALLSVSSRPLILPEALRDHGARLFMVGHLLSFLMVASLLVLFIARISRNLRSRELYLADLRQHAAEEEGIVRMGLFASGAAHELGTPLASLSVILADWRRVPDIAGNPELAEELRVMQAEVHRCKAIVSDILHSAGEPRGEAMARAEVLPFLESVVREWRCAHPQPALEFSCNSADAVIALDPALRQAIWNLLENAAEASATRVRLSAEGEGAMLAIIVADDGAGFPAETLARLGTPYQSTKGAGHGLGLFLASNLARRLGGRLEARNLETGGAEVRLLLPLAKTAGTIAR